MHTWLISLRPLSVSMNFCNQGVEQSVSLPILHMEVAGIGSRLRLIYLLLLLLTLSASKLNSSLWPGKFVVGIISIGFYEKLF
jgi:hypothetical protein